jgi:hypothetical protein
MKRGNEINSDTRERRDKSPVRETILVEKTLVFLDKAKPAVRRGRKAQSLKDSLRQSSCRRKKPGGSVFF